MADTMKSEFLDPIEAECLKSSSSMLALSYCATVIANLEGWKNVMFQPSKEHRSLKIEKLDGRVRRLEKMEGIHSPPPMDTTPSWNSLSWRVARLHRKMPIGPLNQLGSDPPYMTPTLDLLESVTASLVGMRMLSWAMFKGNDNLEGDALLQTAAQFLCYTAGQKRFKIVGSFDLKQNCKLALHMSLDPDTNGCYGGLMLPGPPAPVIHVRPAQPMKSCCGCCNCSCHKSKPAKYNNGVLSWMTRKYHEEKRVKRRGVKARIACAFRKLAFWRRGCDDDTDSDVSSITTRTSSTLD